MTERDSWAAMVPSSSSIAADHFLHTEPLNQTRVHVERENKAGKSCSSAGF